MESTPMEAAELEAVWPDQEGPHRTNFRNYIPYYGDVEQLSGWRTVTRSSSANSTLSTNLLYSSSFKKVGSAPPSTLALLPLLWLRTGAQYPQVQAVQMCDKMSHSLALCPKSPMWEPLSTFLPFVFLP